MSAYMKRDLFEELKRHVVEDLGSTVTTPEEAEELLSDVRDYRALQELVVDEEQFMDHEDFARLTWAFVEEWVAYNLRW